MYKQQAAGSEKRNILTYHCKFWNQRQGGPWDHGRQRWHESTLNDDDGGSNERQRRSKAEELDGSGKRTKELMGKWNLEIMSSKLTRNDEALRPIFASFDVLSIRSTIENGIERLRVGGQLKSKDSTAAIVGWKFTSTLLLISLTYT